MITAQKNAYRFMLPEIDGKYKTGTVFSRKAAEKKLAEGVTYYELKYTNREGKNVNAFALSVEGSSPARFRVWAGDMASVDEGKTTFTRKTVADQAKELGDDTGDEVLAATNAAYFRMSDGSNMPYCMRLVRGRVLCPPRIVTRIPMRPDDWVGITYDGRLVCGNKESYESEWVGRLEYAVAMGVHMMLDGKIDFSKGIVDCNPLTALATTSDGGFILLCVDGRTEASAGATGVDILGMMIDIAGWTPDLLLVNVYTLDGGGSTEMVLKNEENGEFFTANFPSGGPNGGISRKVGDIIAVAIPKQQCEV